MAWRRSGVRIPIAPPVQRVIRTPILKIKRLDFKIKRLDFDDGAARRDIARHKWPSGLRI